MIRYLIYILPLILCGCFATSKYVDRLSAQQAETAKILSSVADLHADLSEELQSLQSPTARKVSIYADQNAGESMDLSRESSSPDMSGFVNKAMTGDWVGLAGLAITSLIGAGYGYQQKKRTNQIREMAYTVAELPPEEATKHLNKHKI